MYYHGQLCQLLPTLMPASLILWLLALFIPTALSLLSLQIRFILSTPSFSISLGAGLLQHQHIAYGIEPSKYGSMLGEVYFQPPLFTVFYAIHFLLYAHSASRCYSQFRVDPFRNVWLIVLKEPENKSLALSLLKIPVLCFPSTPINGVVGEHLEVVGWLEPSWLERLGKGCCSFGTASFL